MDEPEQSGTKWRRPKRAPGLIQTSFVLPEKMLALVDQLARMGYRSRNAQVVMMLETFINQAEAVTRQATAHLMIAADTRPKYGAAEPEKPKEE